MTALLVSAGVDERSGLQREIFDRRIVAVVSGMQPRVLQVQTPQLPHAPRLAGDTFGWGAYNNMSTLADGMV